MVSIVLILCIITCQRNILNENREIGSRWPNQADHTRGAGRSKQLRTTSALPALAGFWEFKWHAFGKQVPPLSSQRLLGNFSVPSFEETGYVSTPPLLRVSEQELEYRSCVLSRANATFSTRIERLAAGGQTKRITHVVLEDRYNSGQRRRCLP